MRLGSVVVVVSWATILLLWVGWAATSGQSASVPRDDPTIKMLRDVHISSRQRAPKTTPAQSNTHAQPNTSTQQNTPAQLGTHAQSNTRHQSRSLAPSSCGPNLKPYHVLLTSSSGTYQEWQTRAFFAHYLRIKAIDACGVVGNFTRLLTLPAGRASDELSQEMQTVLITELKPGVGDLGFVVLNRP